MKLSILDRFSLYNIFPQQGTIEDLYIRRDVMRKVEITQEELTTYTDPLEQGVKFKGEFELPQFDIEFTELEAMKIKKALTDLSDQKLMHINLLHLYELFVENKTNYETNTQELLQPEEKAHK